MASLIPTAEEHFKEYFKGYGYSNQKDLIAWGNAYAKMHVEAAVEEASEKAELTKEIFEFGFPGSTPDITIVDKNSILNAYPLTNIK